MPQFAMAALAAVGSAAAGAAGAAGSAVASAATAAGSAAVSAGSALSAQVGSVLSGASGAAASGATGANALGFSSAASGAASGAASTASAASAAGSSGGIARLLEVGSSAFSSLSSMSAGFQRASAMDLQAGQEMDLGDQERNEALRQANDRSEEMLATIARQRVAFAASGIDLSSGIVGDAAKLTRKRAEREIDRFRDAGEIRRSIRRRKARQLSNQAKGLRGSSILGSVGDFGSTVARVSGRG